MLDQLTHTMPGQVKPWGIGASRVNGTALFCALEIGWGVDVHVSSSEPNSFRKKSGIHIDGFQLGQDFIHLRQLLNNYALYQHAKLYGPDVGQPRKHTQRLLRR